jgi:hypothetical protein
VRPFTQKNSAAYVCFRPELDGSEIKYELPQETILRYFYAHSRGRILGNLNLNVILMCSAAWSPALTRRRAAAGTAGESPGFKGKEFCEER